MQSKFSSEYSFGKSIARFRCYSKRLGANRSENKDDPKWTKSQIQSPRNNIQSILG